MDDKSLMVIKVVKVKQHKRKVSSGKKIIAHKKKSRTKEDIRNDLIAAAMKVIKRQKIKYPDKERFMILSTMKDFYKNDDQYTDKFDNYLFELKQDDDFWEDIMSHFPKLSRAGKITPERLKYVERVAEEVAASEGVRNPEDGRQSIDYDDLTKSDDDWFNKGMKKLGLTEDETFYIFDVHMDSSAFKRHVLEIARTGNYKYFKW